MTAITTPTEATGRRFSIPPRRIALHAFLIVAAALWLFPILWAIFVSLRPLSDTQKHGVFSFPQQLGLDNYLNAWDKSELPQFFFNTMIVTVPGVLLSLLFASMVAFVVSKFRFRFNLVLLMLFTAGNLLPPQAIIVPLYRIYLSIPIPKPFSDNGLLYDQYLGLVVIHVAFQTGFCVFVLSNYMRTLSKELIEAAVVDGAPVFQIYWRVILPLCRPALAALAALEFTFMYNDFFWALVLMKSGDKRPITSALNNLQGQYLQNNNELAALAMIVAVPTIIVFIALQRHFVRGLALGSTKG